MATFSWLTKANAITALQSRLNSSVFWSSDESWQYICEGLRHWNGLTEQWNSSLPINDANGPWINTGTLSGSPRLRSVTDMNLYSQMCYMLLEPQLSSGAWAGTNQFTLANLQENLQKRVQHQGLCLCDGFFHRQYADDVIANAQMIALGVPACGGY